VLYRVARNFSTPSPLCRVGLAVTGHVALLRAVNVGGTGKLPMADLKAMGEACGFANCRTFIASGNLLFDGNLDEAAIKTRLETALLDYAGKRIPVFVRTAAELAAIVAADPFPDAIGSRHMVFFRDLAPPANLIETVRDRRNERIALGLREIYIDYADNIRDTRLKFSLDANGTARNINTVRKLAAMTAEP
jgi:uncharacterized protein (DUF1697 family)